MTFNIDFGRDGIYENSLNLGFNETTWADIYISGIDSPGLVSMGFELAYDNSALELLDTTVTGWDFFNILTASSSVKVSGGMLFDTRIGDNILLASVQFKNIVTADAATTLTLFDQNTSGADFVLSNNAVLDTQLLPSSGVNLAQMNVASDPLSRTVIPQPGSLLLLAAGLLGLAIAKNRIELRTQE
ncbi:hypothetical protein CKO09_03815 [Chromatium weissei]|nr:hypothetical protein [Chromatium weissei]